MNNKIVTSLSNRIIHKRLQKIKWFFGIYPNKKMIKYINGLGSVLTGSRAMKCYDVNEKAILDRETTDWDFLITEKIAYKIFDKFNIEYDLSSKVISISDQMWWRHPDYSDSYRVGPVDINLIIVDKFPEYLEVGEYRVSNLTYILNEKLKLYKVLDIEREKDHKLKHFEDLRQFVIKYNVIKNDLQQ